MRRGSRTLTQAHTKKERRGIMLRDAGEYRKLLREFGAALVSRKDWGGGGGVGFAGFSYSFNINGFNSEGASTSSGSR